MRTILFTLLMMIGSNSFAQIKNSEPPKSQAVYYEIFGAGLFSGSINYDHIHQLHSNHSIRARIGLAFYEGAIVIGSLNYMIGRKKHFGEIGFGGTTFFLLTGEDHPDYFIRSGYRYQGEKGFLLTASLYISTARGSFSESTLYIPGIGMGYAF
jgi:hypothetical protein